MKLKNIHEEIKIQASPEQMWKVISQYGDVSNFHAGVVKSYKTGDSSNQASLGCERVCEIVDLGLNITLKERIVDFVEGKSYKYEVYEWKNFPLRRMLFGFTIVEISPNQTVLAVDIEYKAKPAILTPLMAGKMRSLARDVLLGYKHYAETGEIRVPIKALRTRYKTHQFGEVEYG